MVEALPEEERGRALGSHGPYESLSRLWGELGYVVDPEGFGVRYGQSYAGCLKSYSDSDAGQTKFRAIVQALINEIEGDVRPAARKVTT